MSKAIYRFFTFSVVAFLCLFVSCNKDGVIEGDIPKAPVVSFDNGTGVYTIKVGAELTIEPIVENADDATFAWSLGGERVCESLMYTATWETAGIYYPELTVQTEYGEAVEYVMVEVLEHTAPTISLVVPSQGIKVLPNTDYLIEPLYKYDDLAEFEVEWILNDDVVCTERDYTFNQADLGVYNITIKALNVEGMTTKDISVEVVDQMPYTVSFPSQSQFQPSTDRYTFAGRAIFLTAYTEYVGSATYSWSVDGVAVDCSDRRYSYTPTAEGVHTVVVTVTSDDTETSVSTSVKVHCVSGDESSKKRISNASSSMTQDRVFEWTAAPGQYINDTKTGGMVGDETTLELANAWAEGRLEKEFFVSLGGFGGYIVVGFDHSIENSGGDYDFAVGGNAYDSSNEPGIVWVMQDTNGDGLPNDEWYELKGSETGKAETTQDYAITYYRPTAPKMPVQWTDSEGNEGNITYLGSHSQDYYYPAWISEDSYTLRGTLLSSKNRQDLSTGFWNNLAYDWGYCDNVGDDNMTVGSGAGQRNGFKISNAIQADGSAIDLQYIDFIKIQNGANATSGWLGEVSTEVCSFTDL